MESGVLERCCNICNRWKTLDSFKVYEHTGKRRAQCRECLNRRNRVKRGAPSVTGARVRIADVSRIIGESPHVIRFWLSEFAVFARIERSRKGQRIFTPSQVELLREISRLVHTELFTIEGAKRQLRLAAERERQEHVKAG
jgi:hypothetical protein